MKKKCQHLFKIFHDRDIEKQGLLSFYCTKCLELTLKKKVYRNSIILQPNKEDKDAENKTYK